MILKRTWSRFKKIWYSYELRVFIRAHRKRSVTFSSCEGRGCRPSVDRSVVYFRIIVAVHFTKWLIQSNRMGDQVKRSPLNPPAPSLTKRWHPHWYLWRVCRIDPLEDFFFILMYERVFIWIKETEEKIFFERKQIFALIFRSWSKELTFFKIKCVNLYTIFNYQNRQNIRA